MVGNNLIEMFAGTIYYKLLLIFYSFIFIIIRIISLVSQHQVYNK